MSVIREIAAGRLSDEEIARLESLYSEYKERDEVLTYDDLRRQMLAEGWRFGVVSDFDAVVAQNSDCPQCGKPHQAEAWFQGFLGLAGFQYRAFLYCPDCNRAEEL